MVSKLTGTVEVAGTALPVETYIREFETKAAQSAQGRELPHTGRHESARTGHSIAPKTVVEENPVPGVPAAKSQKRPRDLFNQSSLTTEEYGLG
ncbi:hypothetical protein [Massilia niastensis]|uniref:hypothetical protein n=1 Tax=Massilia niastensis TaxID=544911 RepID=UPI0012ECA991|nr:hypothetical protein [Massilia niastensis]